MKEIIVLSGKGGSGKTSFLSSLASVMDDEFCLADCDVDAANLNLVFQGKREKTFEYYGAKEFTIDPNICSGCGICADNCHFDAINKSDSLNQRQRFPYIIDPFLCEGCGLCANICPVNAISSEPEKTGEYYVSQTKLGKMIHAELIPGAENSGKLVSMVRQKAHEVTQSEESNLLMVDGPPGTGCPVISAVTGTNLALIVTEPTQSGAHDLRRILDLTRYFHVPSKVIINKCDINPEISEEIKIEVKNYDAEVIAELKYDIQVSKGVMASPFSYEALPDHWKEGISNCWVSIKEILKNEI